MNNKTIWRIMWWGVATVVLLLVLMCCIMVLYFDIDPLYELDRPREDALEIQSTALGRQYSCLKFVDGLLIHGKDTYTLAKFIIDKDDASWAALSNRIYVAQVLKPEDIFVLKDREFSIQDEHVGMFMESKETIGEEFVNGWITLYMAHGNDGTAYLYIKGVKIPGRPNDRNAHFRKRKAK